MKYLFYALLCCILITSCAKELSVKNPDALTIDLDPARASGGTYTYKIGDTVKFLMAGKADNILFYSGELNRDYNNATRTAAKGTTQLSFTSNAQNGTQANTLQVLATNKLARVDSANIVAASWTDITSRAVLSTGGGALASGTINVTDLSPGTNDSLFIAFRYTGATGSLQRTWTITNLTVNNVLADGNTAPLVTLATDATYWTRFKIGTSAVNWIPAATQLQVIGGAATAPANVSWIVSRPIYTSRINPDLPIVVKQLASEIPVYTIGGKTYSGYNYIYTKAGTYTATMVVFNKSVDEQKTVTKQFTLKVQ